MALQRTGIQRSGWSADLARIRSDEGARALACPRRDMSSERPRTCLAMRANARLTALGEVADCAPQVGRTAACRTESITLMSLQGWTA
ncbi:hypothetical protein Xmlh_15585 [Xanthomonas axonopodis pv. melhusii]|uniref:Uncharacterized protein n=1 Tax=Xanthomonas axonopodis pv. melhusii TaxID=487834 RepID=A0A1T1NX29_9XANT|nr:hypothetical protein Xmlh_15585 [Xanthomonas axonopodis pv. melhusii]